MTDEATKMAIMAKWLEAVAEEIDADPTLIAEHRDELLDLVSQIAHGPSRPGAPMTLFFLGLRAGQGDDVSELVAKVSDLVKTYQA
ncbi:DUF6457 domain-containing protein [Trueperella pyogenes]|uniref:DUF6457 domain-containing protein n=1 Tax=Trueperella pyogenes TaxID=1661 RepID=UPI003245B4B3